MMMKKNSDTLIGLAWHWSVGMLRRPELDVGHSYCYEMPDGDLVYTVEPRFERAMRVAVWRSAEDGERYVTLAYAPAPKHKFA
jgi:hypothetical protein